MEDAKRQKRRGRPERDPELRVVGIDFNPAPDAQDRLRRLFTILLEHAARQRQAAPDSNDAPPDSRPPDAEEEA